MDISRRKTLRAIITDNLWKRLSPEEARLYLLLIISIDETKKIGKLKKQDIERCLGYSLTVEQLEKIGHTFRELNLAEIEYSKDKSEIKLTLMGRNPQTRETIQIPAKKVPKFVAGKSLREAVR